MRDCKKCPYENNLHACVHSICEVHDTSYAKALKTALEVLKSDDVNILDTSIPEISKN